MVWGSRHAGPVFPKNGLLEAFEQQVRLVRGRFGRYEPIDFLALLLSYAISGERTLADFFERLTPIGTALMALFGRSTTHPAAPKGSQIPRGDGLCREGWDIALAASDWEASRSSHRSREALPLSPRVHW